MAALATASLSACSLMSDDLSDCPTGLYVNFVYDYNIQRADMFKDHVGGLTLYVYDETDRLVAQRTVSGSELSRYGYNMHFTEDELAPGHQYRLQAIALQKDWSVALVTPGAKYRHTDMLKGSNRTQLKVSLDHSPASRQPADTRAASAYYEVSAAAPLDTLWHTLTTLKAEAPDVPAKTSYRLLADGTARTNGVETFQIEHDVPTYATVSLIRDTNHLNLSLREIDKPETIDYANFDVTIIDDNTDVDYENNVIAPADSVVYRPYAQWNAYVESDGQTTADYSAHYDLMFNRLRYNTTTQNNAVLCIRKKDTGEVVALFNLPYILSAARTYYEHESYQPQEYLDREYDYRLELWLKNERWQEGAFLSVCIHNTAWAMRIQYVTIN